MAAFIKRIVDPRMDEFDDVTLVTSPHVSPRTLLCVRIVLFLYSTAITISTIASGSLFYGYFTNWTILGINIYLASAIFNGFRFALQPETIGNIRFRPTAIRWINWILYMLPATTAYIVTIVYWAMIFPTASHETAFLMWLTISQHAANSIIVITELVLGRVPLVYAHLTVFLLVAFSYLAITQIFYLQTKIWAYNFLNTSAPMAWAYYVGVGVFFVIVFYAMTAVHIWRDQRRERNGKDPMGVSVEDLPCYTEEKK
ncbi:hypothetical protein HDU98_000528 [Podochytrium sp. JEL0797]|nr:hypothetical protein HDU98_000528 [Podochytrium sp. JEL0797]